MDRTTSAIIGGASAAVCVTIVLAIWLLVRRFVKKRNAEKEAFLRKHHSVRLKLPLHQALPKKPLYSGVPIQLARRDVKLDMERRVSLPQNFDVARTLAVPTSPHLFSSSEYLTSGMDDEDGVGSAGSRSSESSDEKTKRKRNLSAPTPKKKAKEAPSIHFSVLYTSTNATMTLNVEKITNIPIEYRKHCSVFFKASLQSLNPEVQVNTQHSKMAKDSLNPEFRENFVFSNLAAEDACRAILLVDLYVRKYGMRDKHVGVIQVGLQDVNVQPDQPVQCTEKFTIVKKKGLNLTGRVSLRPDETAMKVMSILVSLEFKAFSNRLKVMIRKATNLPDSRGIMSPHYYVIVNLCHKDEEVTYKETRPISGKNPVWNTPFIFNINAAQVEDHWLQLIVMRGRIYSHDGVIGHVLIGKDTTAIGAEHWAETVKPYSKERQKWHPIVPM